jgi:hypothetical protein
VAVQEIRWFKDVSQPAHNYKFFYGNGNAIHHLGPGLFVKKGILSAVKGVKFISERLSYNTEEVTDVILF